MYTQLKMSRDLNIDTVKDNQQEEGQTDISHPPQNDTKMIPSKQIPSSSIDTICTGRRITIEIVSYGKRRGKPSHNFNKLWNCTNIANPSKSSRKGRTGLDKRLRKEVMMGEEAQLIVRQAIDFCTSQVGAVMSSSNVSSGEGVDIDDSQEEDGVGGGHCSPLIICLGFGCEMGKHRSVSVAVTVAEELMKMNAQYNHIDLDIIVTHRDINTKEERSSTNAGSKGKRKGKKCSRRDYQIEE